MIKVQRALISVSEKKGIVAFARGLHGLGIEILSTGGTARQLKDAGIPVTQVSDYTRFPEMLDGRVKTLHPKIHGGLLALREKDEHMAQTKKHKIGLIDMVVVNLYPFEAVKNRKNVSLSEVIENIDIGGPSMLRSGAKNFKSVAVICNPQRYQTILTELQTNSGLLPDSVLFDLAVEAFKHTAHYDTVISDYLDQRLRCENVDSSKGDQITTEFSALPKDVTLKFSKIQDLRYGENPHQAAGFYRDANGESGLTKIKKLHGKELSFNNILDLNAAIDFVRDSQLPTAVIIKHNNPTGVAQAQTLHTAYQQALSCDPISAFGGIIGLNQTVDEKTANLISKSGFMECVIAPAFDAKAFAILSQKKNLRLIEFDFEDLKTHGFDFKKVHGGLLLQQKDEREIEPCELTVVTKKSPTKSQMESLLFGWHVIRHIKSNAIILVSGKKTVGIGAGQTSRVESVKIAIAKAGANSSGAVLVSDAFIPMTDNITLAADAGITAIIQTGGSIADADVIKAADQAQIAMVMTAVRHFKH